MEGLVGVAIEMIATKADLGYLERSHLTSVQVQDRLKDLQRLSPLPATAEKIDLGERIIFLDLLQCVRRRGPDILDAHPLDSGKVRQADPVTLEAMDLIDWEPTFRTANHWYNRLVAVLRLPDRPSREKELNKFYADLKALKNEAVEPKTFGKLLGKEPASKAVGKRMGETFICLLMPNTRLVHNAQERGEQTQRNLRIAFALAAFQSDHGRYPARLDELAPRHLAEVPNDLFSGKALIYRTSEEGYLLYSVGVNGRDEGARSYGDDPAGDDMPIRMPLPEWEK
jgi:hypothetical protein